MNFLKNLKLWILYITLSSTIIFSSSFEIPSTNQITKKRVYNSLEHNLTNLDTTISDKKPSIPSPIGINDDLETKINIDEESMDIDDEVDYYANPFFSFDLADEAKEDAPLTPAQEGRLTRNSASKSMQDIKIKTAQQREDEDNRYRSSIVLHNIINQIEINKMIEDRLPNLSQSEKDFISLFKNLPSTHLNNPELLNTMHDVEQIKSLQDYTHNFTDTSQLPPYAFLYLNACAEFYPIAQELNEQIQNNPITIKIADTSEVPIQSFDFFHVFMGEMKIFNDSSNDNFHYQSMLKGGHLYLPALTPKVRLFDKYDFDKQSNYFNIVLKSLNTTGTAIKTFYPFGTTPQECFNMLLSAIDNHNITYDAATHSDNITHNPDMISVELIGAQVDIILNILSSGIATFYPKFKD